MLQRKPKQYFNPRSPWGERLNDAGRLLGLIWISIHALREESDCWLHKCWTCCWYFNPRSPWGERPASLLTGASVWSFQSTLSVRRATVGKCCKESPNNISIHALREESDWMMLVVFLGLSEFQSTLSVRRATVDYINVGLAVDISIHALREESDQHRYWRGQAYGHFNPRSPWGERPHDKKACLSCSFYFNPRSPWGERPLYMYRW